MATLRVHIEGQCQLLQTHGQETLHQALSRYGIFHAAPCGGQGLCKHCQVVVRGTLTPPTKQEAEFLSDQELLKGVRYCCMAIPLGDCDVFLDAVSPCQDTLVATPKIHKPQRGYALGIDIGTTTLAMYLYARESGKQIGSESALNRQSMFGDDVISRISSVTTLNALPRLQQSVQEQLSQMILSLCKHANITCKEITSCAVSANTTMLHFLTGLNPQGIAVAPFTPQSLFGTMYRGEQLGLPLSCEVYLVPCISAYVGGDITAGIAACQMDQNTATTLLIDVGTNGEMALCHASNLFCLATAAGPAFEGAHISHGVGGVPGAICQINANGLQTIGNAPPIGICGSGLIDAVALLLDREILDETGYLEEPFCLCENTDLALTPKDIREVQLAKSAIASGIFRLCELAGIETKEIDKVYFAGGFGSHLSPESAAAIGMIPQALITKCQCMGNTAGLGAVQAALSEDFIVRLETIAQHAQYFELSGDARFNELFMENMLFER